MSRGRNTRTQGADRKPNGLETLPFWQVLVMRFATERVAPLLIDYFAWWHECGHALQERCAQRWPDFYTYGFRSQELGEAIKEYGEAVIAVKCKELTASPLRTLKQVAGVIYYLLKANNRQFEEADRSLEAILDRLDAVSNAEPADEASLIDRPEIWHYVLINLPCYFYFGTRYAFLYRAARQGNLEANRKLLKVNKAALFDPRICRHFVANQVEPIDNEPSLTTAFTGHLPYHTRQELKYAVGGMLHGLFAMSVPAYASIGKKYPMVDLPSGVTTSPQVKWCFDDVERRKSGLLEDPELGDQAAFSRAKRRWAKRFYR